MTRPPSEERSVSKNPQTDLPSDPDDPSADAEQSGHDVAGGADAEVAAGSGSDGSRYPRTDRGAQKRSRAIRWAALLGVLALVTTIGVLHQRMGAGKPVGVDALCPFGGIETLWSWLSSGALIQRIAVSSLVLLAATVVLALVFRRAFCGYVCPLGALQELFGKLGSRAFGRNKRPVVPAALDRPARWLKYGILAFFTLWTWQAATLVMRPYDPWVAYMHLTSGELFAEFGIGLAVLGVSLAGSIVYERFFCKYLCPMGATLAVLSPLSVFKVVRTESACIDCAACDKACPVNVPVSTSTVVNDWECINCNECVNVCPAAGALEVATSRGSVLSPNRVLGVTAIIVAGVIGVATLAGAFAWRMPGGGGEGAAIAAPAPGTAVDVNNIRGSMTFADIASYTSVPAIAFERQYGVAPQDMTVPVKDIAAKYGFDVHTDLRAFAAEQIAAGNVVAPGTTPAGESCPECSEQGK
jgi:polyferredoxin